jgi:signal transduction histidine kinase
LALVRDVAVEDWAVGSRQDFPLVIAAMPINERAARIARGVIVLLLSVAAMVAPFASTPLARVDAFIPVLQTVMCVVDLITAALLFAQYSIYPMRALLAVAGGYVFAGLFAFIQTLAFPGAYSATGLIGDGVNSAAWLFVLWHTTFNLAVIVYVLLSDAGESASLYMKSSPATTIRVTIASIVGVTVVLTWIVTKGSGYLPTLYESVTGQTPLARSMDAFLWSLSAVSLVLLFVRRRTILDLWLLVILLAWWPNFILPIFVTVVRFTVGWYVGRFFALFASSTLLYLLLAESMVLYGRLAHANVLLQRERTDRLMSVEAATAAMAHEMRQPLTAIANYSMACLNWLRRTPPHLEEVRSCVNSIIVSTHRTDEVIASIRELYRKSISQRTMIDANNVVRQSLSLVNYDLRANQICVETAYQENLPRINADNTQLEQVILNLIRNAVDAMASASVGKKDLRLATRLDNNNSMVSIIVEDSGPGINADDRERIFKPFFTTKSAGMGLGLSLCRTIIEDHGGHFLLTKTDSYGSIFEISLPIAQEAPATAPAASPRSPQSIAHHRP